MSGIAGLNIDTVNVLGIPPSIVLYGPPGVGKSTEMARAFNNVLYVQSSPSILHAYAHWASMSPQLKLKVPDRLTLDEKYVAAYAEGGRNKAPTVSAVIDVVTKYIAACDAGTSPYEGIVFDEWSTLCERMFAELKTDPWGTFRGRNGNLNIFAVFDAFKQVHRTVLSLARRTRKMVGFVSHHQGPRIDDDDASPTKGAIKWPGGPKMPMGMSDQIIELCADADVVLQLVVQDPKTGGLLMPMPEAAPAPAAAPAATVVTPPAALGSVLAMQQNPSPAQAAPAFAGPQSTTPDGAKRVFLTQLDTKWFRKVRGFGIAPEETLDIHQSKGLRELLHRAGFPV